MAPSLTRHLLARSSPRQTAGPALAIRQRGQSTVVTRHAWKAQQRLYAMYHRLSLRRGPQIAPLRAMTEPPSTPDRSSDVPKVRSIHAGARERRDPTEALTRDHGIPGSSAPARMPNA